VSGQGQGLLATALAPQKFPPAACSRPGGGSWAASSVEAVPGRKGFQDGPRQASRHKKPRFRAGRNSRCGCELSPRAYQH
jgi:hypothetical protein